MGYAGLRMTADEYLALGETHERYELIDGVVVMSPSPRPLHNRLALRIAALLDDHGEFGKSLLVFPETDLRLTRGKVYRPDISIYRSGRLPANVERLELPPDLVVEILSPGSKPFDYITKRDDYEAFGVVEYWVVDPETGGVRAWHRHGSKLLESPVEGDTVPSFAIKGFALPLKDIQAIIKRQ